ncbi:MAG TPA: hypothetical protein VNI84_13820 [Pyrinomonadaceae bacterium]|nr:hypothetical protein [Pyrinomonadaceae bacterium]
MSDKKPTIHKKREQIEREAEEAARIEKAMLKLLTEKYPSEAAKFARLVSRELSLKLC